MDLEISDCGSSNDREMDTLEGEIYAQVLSERGHDLATYAGYSYVKPRRPGIDAARLNVWGTGQDIGYRLIADNRTDQRAQVRFCVSVQDSGGRVLGKEARFDVAADPRSRAARRICFSLDRNGTYALAYRAETGQRAFDGEIDFAVVPPEDQELASTSPFGLHAGHCRLLQAANMRWSRNGQVIFAELLSDAENRDWTTLEQVLHAAERHRLMLIPVIQCNPEKRWTANPLKDYTRFRAFVRDLVAEFKQRQKIWEIVNEPNIEGFSPEQYMQVLEAGYHGAKEADPDCTLVMGGTSLIDMPYIRRLGQLGLTGLCDVLSVHPYYPAEPPEGELLSKLRELQQWRDREAAGKPMWSTEIAWWTAGEEGVVDEPTLLDYLVRSSVLQLAHDQEVVLWTVGADRMWSTNLHKAGLYRVDLTPKDTYVAFAALSRLLSGKQFVGSPDRGEGIFACSFEGRGERIEAVWSAGEEREVEVQTRGPSTVLDVFANPVESLPAGGGAVRAGRTPVFVLER